VLMAIHPDGSVVWRSHNSDGSRFAVGGNGGPSVADLDDDGQAEVILGATVFSSDGTVRWSRSLTAGSRYNSPLTTIADLDEDGSPEIVAANKAWRTNGFPFWENSMLVDGWVAVASLTVPGLPDVVSISNDNLYVLDPLTGAVRRGPVNLPNGAGPPVIADLDGDDRVEIGTVMQGRLTTEAAYVAIDFDDPDGILWSSPVQDESAAFTASSVFDFDGDGRAEVVYNDECYLDVLDGPTGTPLLRLPNQNTTALPYALVADVDADGNAEIVAPVHTAPHVAYCREPAPGAVANGVRVYGDRMDNWVATRPIWNQHTYHGTNVNDDGTIPGRESRWWEDENSFRRNVQPHPFLAPDLLADGVAADGTSCPTKLTLAVRVRNEGSVGAPAGVPVAAYLLEDTGPRWVGVGRTTEPIVPGGTAVARIVIESPPSDPVRTFDFEVVVDDDGTGTGEHNECDESNNRGRIDGVACQPPG